MKTAGSVLSLVSVLFACFAFIFVWAGTEFVHFEWLAMNNDLTAGQVNAELQASQAKDYAEEEGKADAMTGAAAASVDGAYFILWLNVSGFRGDYLEHTETPFLDSLAQQGSSTSGLQPVFPSLHYPTLISQATGRIVKDHGVISDKLRHPETGQIVTHPTDLKLLKAEPVWTTAKRQGVGVLVHHWPFSQQQPAEHAADSFLPEVNFTSSAEERLNALLDAWAAHQAEPKIRLAMLSIQDLDQAARTYGIRQKETFQALEKLDKTLAGFRDRLREKWPSIRGKESDRLMLMITTDHGMADVKKVINFGALMGDLAQQVDYAASEAIAQLWFKPQPEGTDRSKFEAAYDNELKARIYWRTYTPDEIPQDWKLGTGPQTGDRVLVLKSGYSFTDKTGSEPVFDPSETGGPFAGCGYLAADQSRMLGQAFFSTIEGATGKTSNSLGSIDSPQLYATVCRLLGIKPADGVVASSLYLD